MPVNPIPSTFGSGGSGLNPTADPVNNLQKILSDHANAINTFSSTVHTDSTLTGTGTVGSPLHVVGGQTGDYQQQLKLRGAGFLGTSNLSSLYWMFNNGVDGRTQNLVGASGVAQAISIGDSAGSDNNAIGGVGTFGTGTATTGSSQLLPGNTGAGRSPMLSATHSTTKFYFASRFQMTSAVDANTLCGTGTTNWFIGVDGRNSTTKFCLGATTNAGSTHYVTSTVSIDLLWHTFETWNDGTTAWISVDGETPVGAASTSWWPLTNPNNSSPLVSFGKVTGTTNYTGAVNLCLWMVNGP